MIKVYRELKRGEHCVIGADTAEVSDFCSAVCVSKFHADSVIVFNERIDSSQFGYELYKLGTYIYKKTDIWPTIGVERNMGQATIAKLLELNYRSLFRMKTFDEYSNEMSEKIGWVTTTSSRVKMLDELYLALKQRTHKIYDAETVSQLYSFIRNPRTNKPEAERSAHDDIVMAEAIAWQLYQLVPTHSLVEENLIPDDSIWISKL